MIELDRYVLDFTAPLHLANRGSGLASTDSTVRSDTLFSALCLGLAATRGPALVAELFEWFQEGLAPFVLS